MSTAQPILQSTPPKVFISYSHADTRWLNEFKTHLTPYLRGAKIDAWDDTRINPGERWREAIEDALASADVGVLLVTPKFLDSPFIAENELPPLLEGKCIFWIAVSASSVEVTPIAKFQAANDPARPLNTLRPAQRAREWVSICKKLSEAADKRAAEQTEGGPIASPASKAGTSTPRRRTTKPAEQVAQSEKEPETTPPSSTPDAEEYNETDCINLLEAWLGRRKFGGVQTMKFSEVDYDADVPAGTAKKHLKAAAGKVGFEVLEEGGATIRINTGSRGHTGGGCF